MKDTTISLRCSDYYKEEMIRTADKLCLTLSQCFRFSQMCRLYLEDNEPELFNQLLETCKNIDF